MEWLILIIPINMKLCLFDILLFSGKTCLLVRFSQGKYLKDYSILTMFENYKADIYVNEKLVQVCL